MFSALKKEGKRLYEYARAGKEVKIDSREIFIRDFNITSIELPFLKFEVTCSKGTYIRSLAHDLGSSLESGGYLTTLRREKIGDFKVENAFLIDEIIQVIQKGTNF